MRLCWIMLSDPDTEEKVNFNECKTCVSVLQAILNVTLKAT